MICGDVNDADKKEMNELYPRVLYDRIVGFTSFLTANSAITMIFRPCTYEMLAFANETVWIIYAPNAENVFLLWAKYGLGAFCICLW